MQRPLPLIRISITKKNFVQSLLLIGLFAFGIPFSGNSQTNYDFTDSMVNQQKHFVIRFDVANGNIYVPVKKKTRRVSSNINLFKGSLLKMKETMMVPLYKDTIIQGAKGRVAYAFAEIKNPRYKSTDSLRYLLPGRYLKPRVDGFIRLIFENVPKGQDIKVAVDFVDKNLEGAATFANYLNSFSTNLNDAVNKQTDSVTQIINKTQSKADSIQFTRDTLIQSLSSQLRDSLKKNIKLIYENAEKVDSMVNYRTQNQDVTFDLSPETKEISEILDKLKKLRTDSTPVQIDTLEGKYFFKDNADLQEITNRLFSFQRRLNSRGDNVDALLDNITTNLALLKTNRDILLNKINSDFSTRISGLTKAIDSLKHGLDSTIGVLRDSLYTKNTIYIQPIQVANTDLTVLSIKYQETTTASINRTIILKNKAGFKLDFSTGFVGTSLRDDNYRLHIRNSDSAAIVSDPKGQFTIGFTLLAHAYFRTGARFNIALTSGFALNGSNQTINYILGAGIPLGLEQRFIISGGFIFGKVKKLQAGYKIFPDTDSLQSDNYNNYFYRNISNSGPPLIDSWRSSYFIGITYNLGSLVGGSRKTIVGR